MLEIQALNDARLPEARALLERHCETSLALLSNIAEQGYHLTAHANSGDIKLISENGRVAAVFVLTRRGHLLVQTDRAQDYSAAILQACASQPLPMSGVLADWSLAEPLWQAFTAAAPAVTTTFRSREVLYRLALERVPDADPTPVRGLVDADFADWLRCHDDFLAEAGLPPAPPLAQRRETFAQKTALGHYWGYFEQGQLASMAALSQGAPGIGQVGGVYTPPAYRRRGYAKATMHQLLLDARAHQGLQTIVLFTGDENQRAQAMYEGLGFERIGHFGLFFGGAT